MSARVYGTWTDLNTGIRHFASGVPRVNTTHRNSEWDTNLLCGPYVDYKPFAAARGVIVVTCLRCLYRWLKPLDPNSILRGHHADYIVMDEAQDFDQALLAEITEKLEP